MTTVHGSKYNGIIDRWWIIGVIPRLGVMNGSVVLMCHDIKLIKVDERNICIRPCIEVFNRHKCEGD